MTAFTDYVRMSDVDIWLQNFAGPYKSCSGRQKFISTVEVQQYLVNNARKIRMVFVAYRRDNKHLATVVVPDIESPTGSKPIDAILRPLHYDSVSKGDKDTVMRIQALRYHIGRQAIAVNDYYTKGKTITILSSYLWPIRKFLRLSVTSPASDSDDHADTLSDSSDASDFNTDNLTQHDKESCLNADTHSDADPSLENAANAASANTIPKVGFSVVSWFTDTARSALRSLNDIQSSDTDPSAPTNTCANDTASEYASCCDTDSSQKVAGRNFGEDIARVELKTAKSVDKKRKLALASSTTTSSSKLVNVSRDVPCFQVVNSSVKSIPGYARIQIGGPIEPKFAGKYIPDRCLLYVRAEVKSYVAKLREQHITNVLLSGTLWTDKCSMSGDSLNADMPKWFDGMNVKVIASARYGNRIASAVRDHLCKMEQPFVDDDMVLYTEAEEYQDLVVDADEDWEKTTSNLTEDWERSPDLDLLKIHYDAAYPACSYLDQEHKQMDFHSRPSDITMPEINLRAPILEEFDERTTCPSSYMEPVMQTHLEPRHPVNQKELVYSVFNRNYMPPKEQSMIVSIDVATELYTTFLSCIKKRPSRLLVSDADISGYIQRKGESLVSDLKRLMHELPQRLDRWDALVKGTAKPVLSDDAGGLYSPTQVIICKDKLYNVRYGPLLSKIKSSIMRDLNSDIFIYSEDSNDGLQRKLTRNRPSMRGNVLEIDMSKYDKSQGVTALYFDMMIFMAYGMSREDAADWFVSHWYSYIQSMTGRTRFNLPAQRKSGDPWTYYGNTLYLMCVLKRSLLRAGYPTNYMMISGDDSLIWSHLPVDKERSVVEYLARDYNLDAKLIKASSLYFCSRFMLTVNDNIYLVADPVKILIKLGKRDVRDRGHIEELRIALLDQISNYRYLEIRHAISRVVTDRYPAVAMVEDLMSNMYGFAATPIAYNSLFRDRQDAVRKAILVSFDLDIVSGKRFVVHEDLVKRDITRFDLPKLGEYMRNVGKNAGKRLLITYNQDYVPQGTMVVADLRNAYNPLLFNELVQKYYRA